MVDTSTLAGVQRASQRPRRTQVRQTEPPAPRPGVLDTLGQLLGSRSQAIPGIATDPYQTAYAYSLPGSFGVDVVRGSTELSPGQDRALGYGALAGDLLMPSLLGTGLALDAKAAAQPVLAGANALKDLGVKGASRFVMSAADPAAAQALAGKSLQEVVQDPSGMQAAIMRYLGRHRSTRPDLGRNLTHPLDVPVDTGRMYGPGTYFAQTPKASEDIFPAFGEKVYRMGSSPREMWDTVRNTAGYAVDDTFTSLGVPRPGTLTPWDDAGLATLRGRGFLGYAHGDAFTDWMLGAGTPSRLVRTGDASVPGIFDVRGRAGYAGAQMREGYNQLLDSFASSLGRGDSSAMPKVLRELVERRTGPQPLGEGFRDIRLHNPNPRLVSMFDQIGLGRLWPEAPPPPAPRGRTFGELPPPR